MAEKQPNQKGAEVSEEEKKKFYEQLKKTEEKKNPKTTCYT